MHECVFFNSSCKWIGLGVKEFHFTYNPTSKKEVLLYFTHTEKLCNAAGKQLLVMLWLWLAAFVASLFHQKEKKNIVAH